MRVNHSFIATSILALGTFIFSTANIYAQGGEGSQQHVRADGRGDIIRGLPQRGSGASGGAVATGNGINWNGGPVLHTVNLYYIWYGNWGQDTKASAILNNFANNIGGSPYFNINTTYGDNSGNVPNAVTFKGSYTDAGSQGTSLNDNSIFTIVSNAIASGALGPADPNGMYQVLTAPGVNETSGFLTQYCGWHTAGSYNGTTIQYAFIGDAAGPNLGSCAWQTSSSPNNDPGADAMVSVIAHELEETASDPHLNAWYDSSGNENADKCAWTFGTTYNPGNGSLANMTLGGMNYLIQQNWVNAGGGYCALSYAASPDFSVSVSSSQSVSQGGTSANYTLTATPQNGFDVSTVTWSFGTMPAGITYTPTSSLMAGTATFTLTAASNAAGGTYSIPITGTSGALHHSLNASLVVTAPDFSVSVSGSQSVLPGATSANYTLTDTPLNGFNGTVTWTFGTLPTGITVNAVNPLQGSPATFTLSVGSGVTPATYSIPITGTSGSLSHSVSATLVVSAPTFSLTITPSSQSISRPSGTTTVTYTVKVNSIGGYAGSVNLAASGGTTGISPSITGTNPVAAGGSGTLSVVVSNNAKKGNRTLTVTGTAGKTVNSATATIQVH